MQAFYRQTGEGRFESTAATAGPWSAQAQHAGPPSALVAREMAAHEPRPGMRLADLRVDILGPIPLSPLQVRVHTARAGRSMELLEATVTAADTPVVLARGWRIMRSPDTFPALVGHRQAAPADPVSDADTDADTEADADAVPAQELSMPGAHTQGYLSAVEWKMLDGGPGTGGTATAWGRQLVPLVAGEEPSPWERTLVLADSGGGITLTIDPRRHTYINCDLHVVLDRDPTGEWIRMSSQALASPRHGGLVHTTLADAHGDVGFGLQTMFAADARS